jgi:putative DNA primase/helicase
MANHQPRVDAGGESFWRRLRLLPFTTVVPKERRVEGLANQLIAPKGPASSPGSSTAPARPSPPASASRTSVMEATAQYAEEEDAVARFVAERCHIGGGHLARVATRDMRAAYESWCRDEGQRPISAQMFGREIRARYGVADARSNGRRYYTGVTLLHPEDDEPTDGHWSDR